MPRAVVLVEGQSDRNAVEALARRRGVDLTAGGVAVVPMGGITNLHRFLVTFGPAGPGSPVVGLYDAAEERVVRQALERTRVELASGPAGLESAGFHACVPDLEAELIRALGVAAMEAVITARGERGALRTFRTQRHWAGRPPEDQLRRFLGSGGSRKTEYAPLLVAALDAERVPPPLERVLADALRVAG